MDTLKSLSREHYAVGWVAALSIELAAAAAMLDEVHEKPFDFEQLPSDTNSYTWGEIAKHNVVMANLPAGSYGTSSAANVAMNMLASFPQIRFGLLVGIAAGIPNESVDIRLDFKRAEAGGRAEPVGFLNSPPVLLLNAMNKLKAKHEFRCSVPDHLKTMVQKHPEMGEATSEGPSYTYQGRENDRLFNSAYDHISGDNCDECDSAQVIQREDRVSTNPAIRYGLIASGNTLVKSAAVRDAIRRDSDNDCICLEMEAAGLINDFPSLDFANYDSELLDKLKGAKGCVWALGINQTQVDAEEYVKITKTFALEAAKAFQHLASDEQPFNFVYVSGGGATTEPGKFSRIFARVKGEVEAALAEMRRADPSFHAVSVRPLAVDASAHAAIKPYIPTPPLLLRVLMPVLGPPVRTFFTGMHSPTEHLGRVLTELAMGRHEDHWSSHYLLDHDSESIDTDLAKGRNTAVLDSLRMIARPAELEVFVSVMEFGPGEEARLMRMADTYGNDIHEYFAHDKQEVLQNPTKFASAQLVAGQVGRLRAREECSGPRTAAVVNQEEGLCLSPQGQQMRRRDAAGGEMARVDQERMNLILGEKDCRALVGMEICKRGK
ncbi:hypothetical protein VP1G_07082 [Cytospora mali]|uniref:Nucleoside phosphorylase domain-containing protein n=1 Tax=Cytospora mali TaxID=578113 RepID=A0A194V7E7_CYTMA|nr:hypothetical protein VP1G_07082 [Valsa mali var. pyri (nom. inval.)]